MYRSEAIEGFHFDDHALFHEEVESESLLQVEPLMREVDRSLTLDKLARDVRALCRGAAHTPTRAAPAPSRDESGSPPPPPHP